MYLLILFLFMVFLILSINTKEGFAGQGALMQLYAKGPQDAYLTDSNYIYPWYYNILPQFIWNNPTRYYNNYLYDIRGYPYVPWYNWYRWY